MMDRARGANRPERLEPLNPKPRYLGHGDSKGELANPGYTCVARRPRIGQETEIMSLDRADRMEEIVRGIPDYPDY